MSAYQAARAEATDYLAEADQHLARTGRLPSIPLPADLLRTLLAGPPEPSVEEPVAWRWKQGTRIGFTVHRHIADEIATDPSIEVQALYRSKGAPKPDE